MPEPARPRDVALPDGVTPAGMLPDDAGPEHAASAAVAAEMSLRDAELSRLRELLLSPEMKLLEDLRRRLDDPINHARDVSTIITEALTLRAGRDDTISKALEPAIQEGFTTLLRKRPTEIATALFPIIGSTIRRSIAEALRSMLEGFSKTLELSFSLKGLRWRFEALRTGKSFSETVLLHTILYRVEQVFFIHAETGLVLAHVVGEGVESKDADMVSAMLTAIQDFARDSFTRDKEGELESLRLGEFTILLERAPQAYLACVVRGTPPAEFPQRMRTALEFMVLETSEELAEFQGDNGPFIAIEHYMQDLLIAKTIDADKAVPFKTKLLAAVVLLAIVFGVGFYCFSGWRERTALAERRQHLEEGLALLRAEPGYAALNAQRDDGFGPWKVWGLKDSSARSPEDVLAEAGYSVADYELVLAPYLSYQPDLLERRLREKLNPAPGVSIELGDDGTVYMSGIAPMGWILEARRMALSQPGVNGVDVSGLYDPRNDELAALVRSLQGATVLFPLGQAIPEGGELARLNGLVDSLARLEDLASELGMMVSLTIYGHADVTGTEKRNYEISQERAKTFAAMLYSRGSSMPIALHGMGADYADPDGGDVSRKVELRVNLNQAPQAELEILHGLGR